MAPASRRQNETVGGNGFAPTTTVSAWIAPSQPAPATPGSIRQTLCACMNRSRARRTISCLFMHHLPYTYVLHSGKTIVQSVYDGHYAAAAEAQEFPQWWDSLRGLVDEQRFASVLDHLEYQAGHAMVWRDAICQWFEHMSGIPDGAHRVGHDPDRHEAEDMQLSGYTVTGITPWEDASKGKAVTCPAEKCEATFTYNGEPGWRDIAVQYFDTNNGSARFHLFVNQQQVAEWTADADLPGNQPNGDTSTRRTVRGVWLEHADTIRITANPDREDHAALDYVEIRPASQPE